MLTFSILWPVILLVVAGGCLFPQRQQNTPVAAGLNTNNLIDPLGQGSVPAQLTSSTGQNAVTAPGSRHVLCLSGGGAYGAYTVGVICGWTQCGNRPCFDVVTGISTGALIAPYAFLGSSCDNLIRELYTTTDDRDIYRLRPISGAFSEAFASNRPLARKLDELITMDLMRAIAREYQRGRRLYVGTTEMEGHRFIVWDIGAIACRGRPEDLDLFKKILLASTAIPGIFPPVRIPVTVNQQPFCEMHVDGTVSQSVFFLPPSAIKPGNTSVYVIVAGKLFADPEPVNPRATTIAMENLQSFSYAHTRGDVYRIWSVCRTSGFGFHLNAIPEEYSSPAPMTQIDREFMNQLYQEGVRQALSGNLWRSVPPGQGPGEDALIRSSTDLIVVPRSNAAVVRR